MASSLPITLSKSDFQLATSCPKKLVYKKAKYPTTNDTDEYMEMLAQGGYVIGKMATLYHENGIEIEGKTADCILRTEELLQKKNVILFEAAIQSGQKLVRIDILEKQGNNLHLIEVKSKSFDSSNPASVKELGPYIEDVAYQYYVLAEKFPGYQIKCSLFMPDKSQYTEIDGLAGWFSMVQSQKDSDRGVEEIITQEMSVFRKPEVVFKYENDPDRKLYVDQLKEQGILTLLDVTVEVLQLQPSIQQSSDTFLRILNEGIQPSDFQISKNCKGCEFDTPNEKKNGYFECWGKKGYKEHHMFDLYFGGSVKNENKEFYLDELIAKKKTSLFDISIDVLKGSKDKPGKRALRQILQIEKTRENVEWISAELKRFFKNVQYPLHFIDFETYTGAIPFHKHMRPYELIAFQWSCHTISHKGAAPTHKEWIHTGESFPEADQFPNFAFAKSLMQHIGHHGTPFMWAKHENTVLRTILNQMDTFANDDPELKDWLVEMTSDSSEEREGRLVDMNQLTLDYYFHPYMKGRTSIKKVLPAIWSHFSYLHSVPFFAQYSPKNWTEGIIDPYDELKAMNNGEASDDDVVAGGTDAMRAYHRIRFDDSLTDLQKSEIRRQLLEYCKLDTLAMVIIAHHWGLR